MLLNDLAIWCMKYVAADLSINGGFSFIFSSHYCCTVQETFRSLVCYSLRVLQFECKAKLISYIFS